MIMRGGKAQLHQNACPAEDQKLGSMKLIPDCSLSLGGYCLGEPSGFRMVKVMAAVNPSSNFATMGCLGTALPVKAISMVLK